MQKKVRAILKTMNRNPILLCVVAAFLEVFVIEAFHNKSLAGAVAFVRHYPLPYLINVMLLLSFFMLCLISKRRLFWAFLIGLLWLILGVANYFVLLNRVSPLSWADVSVLSSVASIIRQYMKPWQLVAVCIALFFWAHHQLV